MITHVPSPYERMIRRICANIGDWMDRRAVRKLVKEHGIPAPPEPPASVVRDVVDVPGPSMRTETAPEPARRRQVAQKRSGRRPVPKDLHGAIAKAIREGRASGSQRDLAKMFNVSKTTVVRAQRLAREMAELH